MKSPRTCPTLCEKRPGWISIALGRETDVEKAVWAVPAETMKMKRPHRVPLSRQAIVIFRELHALTGQGDYVFPAVNSFRRPKSNNTLNAALRRLGHAKDEIRVSGFRATASTLLKAETGVRFPLGAPMISTT